jgi:hypothetical protein
METRGVSERNGPGRDAVQSPASIASACRRRRDPDHGPGGWESLGGRVGPALRRAIWAGPDPPVPHLFKLPEHGAGSPLKSCLETAARDIQVPGTVTVTVTGDLAPGSRAAAGP